MFGFSIGIKFDKFGMRGLNILELIFEDCKVLGEFLFLFLLKVKYSKFIIFIVILYFICK